MAAWDATEVAVELMEAMTYVPNQDASRSGFANEDPDSPEIEGDITLTVSGIIDVNNTTISPAVTTLLRTAQIVERILHSKPNIIVHWLRSHL